MPPGDRPGGAIFLEWQRQSSLAQGNEASCTDWNGQSCLLLSDHRCGDLRASRPPPPALTLPRQVLGHAGRPRMQTTAIVGVVKGSVGRQEEPASNGRVDYRTPPGRTRTCAPRPSRASLWLPTDGSVHAFLAGLFAVSSCVGWQVSVVETACGWL